MVIFVGAIIEDKLNLCEGLAGVSIHGRYCSSN